MSKCIILSRVSTAQQSLDSQTQAIINEAIREGFKEKDFIIIEEVESAIKLSEEERNGLNRMKEAIENDSSITHMFIYELSRLSRRQLVLFSIRDYLIEHNIQLVCCTPYFRMLENGKLSQTANLMFSIFASMAESEMQLKQERMIRGRKRNKMIGKLDQGKLIYGYKKLEDKTIAVDEESSIVVKEVFTMYADKRHSIKDVAIEILERYGTENDTLDKMFQKIARMLVQKKYCGDMQYPQIISEELFEKCREAAKSNINDNKHFVNDTALLKRIIYSNGKHMTYKGFVGKQMYSSSYPATTVQLKHIDAPVFQLAVVLHKAYVDDNKRIRNELNSKKEAAVDKILNSQMKKRKLAEKIDKVEERLIYGGLSETKAEHLETQLRKSIKECEDTIAKANETIVEIDKMLDNAPTELPDYESFSKEEKIAIIRQMIERIDVERKSKYVVVATIKTKVDHFIYEITIDTYKNVNYMSTKPIS